VANRKFPKTLLVTIGGDTSGVFFLAGTDLESISADDGDTVATYTLVETSRLNVRTSLDPIARKSKKGGRRG
jgi:hypothetical protein